MNIDITTTNRPDGTEYYLVIRARTSCSKYATRINGGLVDTFSIRAAAINPPKNIPTSEAQLVIPLGPISREHANTVCQRVADSGLIADVFQDTTDPGVTNAKICCESGTIDSIVTIATAPLNPGRPSVAADETETVRISVTIGAETRAHLDKIAERANTTRSEVLRQAIARIVEHDRRPRRSGARLDTTLAQRLPATWEQEIAGQDEDLRAQRPPAADAP
jgi:predicted transcriptional regulator